MVAGGVVLAAVVVLDAANVLWGRATARDVTRLGTTAGPRLTFLPRETARLPAPVMRYFQFALTPEQRLPRRAHMRWTGEFRLRPDAAWVPFTAEQRFNMQSPGFVWDASIRMAGPLLPARVRDSYIDGEGAMLGRLAAVVPIVDQHGTPEMAAGALARWLGEGVWAPTALLPGPGVAWSPIDDSTARAKVTDGAVTVTGDFHFAAGGEITRVSMTRFRDVNGRGVPTPFEGRYFGYRRVAGMMIPAGGEVAWILPEGRFAYWRGRIGDVRYEPAP